MAKSKAKSGRRKPKSNRISVAPDRIKQAQYAKQHGLLSKNANLRNGKLSRSVAKKIDAFERLRVVPTYMQKQGAKTLTIADPPIRKAVTIPRKMQAEAKQSGFVVIRGKIVTSDPKGTKEALADNRLAGTTLFPGNDAKETGIQRLSAGAIERIKLTSFKIRNFRDLYKALKDGRLENRAKHPLEFYTFTLFDFGPNPNKYDDIPGENLADFYAFDGDAELLAYLERYKILNDAVKHPRSQEAEDAFDGFELFRMYYGQRLEPPPDEAYNRQRARRGIFTPQDRRSKNKRRAKAMKEKKEMQTYEEYKAKQKEAQRIRRAKETPEQRAERMRKDAERHREYYASRKEASENRKKG